MEKINQNEISYEEEQLQSIILNEIEQNKLNQERKLKEKQDLEYKESLQQDLKDSKNQEKINLSFEEVSLEEMRRIRLLRFSN